MNIILEPHKMNSVAFKLRDESEDYYLFFLCMYHTGLTGARLLGLKVKDLDNFIEENHDFLGDVLINELRMHNLGKTEDTPVFCNKYSLSPLPRRTIVYWVNYTAKVVLNVDDFGFRTVTKTFYYEYFRNNGYNFNVVRKLFGVRKQYMPDLDAFLDYCGLSVEEYQADRNLHSNNEDNDYLTNLKEINNTIFSLCASTSLSSVQKNNLAEVTKEILALLKPFTNL